MTIDVIHELRKLGRGLPEKNEPIPVSLGQELGLVGHVEHRRGLYLNSATERHVRALIRDHYRMERLARDATNGWFGAEILNVAALGTDSRDAIRAIKQVRMAITSWDSIINARTSGKFWDFMGTKASQTTVAAAWSSFLRTAGVPPAASFTTIPGPAAWDASTTGAWPLPMTLGATENLYLTTLGVNHATGSNIVMAVDVLTANGSILTSIVTSQNVQSTTLPRWTGGAGVHITLEVVTTPGSSTGVPNVTVNYTNQAGTGNQSTGAVSLGVTSAIAGRLLPVQDGPFIRLASGDYGVQAVSQVTFSVSAAGAGGSMALIQYKPIILVPTLASTSWVERSAPAQLGGIRALTSVAQGSKPFIGFFVLTSTTSTGVQDYLLETVYG